MIGASGVGRLPPRTGGGSIESPSSSFRRSSWPLSLCMGLSDGEAPGSVLLLGPGSGSVRGRIQFAQNMYQEF